MKTLAYVLIGFVSIFCLVGLLSSPAEASDYLGDFCWTIAFLDGVPSGIAKASVSYIGGGHYLLSGKITADDGKVYIGHSNAEVEGNSILISVNGSGQSAEDMESGTVHVVLETATLNGTWESMGHDVNYSDHSIDIEHETGSLTFIPCP
jgi:hypothetical protein